MAGAWLRVESPSFLSSLLLTTLNASALDLEHEHFRESVSYKVVCMCLSTVLPSSSRFRTRWSCICSICSGRCGAGWCLH